MNLIGRKKIKGMPRDHQVAFRYRILAHTWLQKAQFLVIMHSIFTKLRITNTMKRHLLKCYSENLHSIRTVARAGTNENIMLQKYFVLMLLTVLLVCVLKAKNVFWKFFKNFFASLTHFCFRNDVSSFATAFIAIQNQFYVLKLVKLQILQNIIEII